MTKQVPSAPSPDGDHLAERYGRPSRLLTWAAAAIFTVVVVGVVAWTVLASVVDNAADPGVRAGLQGYDVVDDHTATATVDVRLADRPATCVVRASAEDKVTVGEETFEAQEGINEVTVRTERLATSVDLVSCTEH